MNDQPLSLEAALERFVEQLRSARPISPRDFAALHPALAPDLLPALEAAEDLESLKHEAEPDLPEGLERIGHFRIERELGRGGMGIVFAAFDEELARDVALKLLPRALLSSPSARARFQREANLAARLDHPGICTVHSAGVTDGQPWIAMRRLKGHSLADDIAVARAQSTGRATELPLARARELVRAIASVARALAFAHARGVIHRDVKPSNVMLTDDGQAVLLDFGVAFDVGGPQLTGTGETAGTPAYLAPELISGERERPDERCDVYALGVTLYECLTLRQPYSAPTRDALYRTILDGGAPDVRRWNARLPRDLSVIVATAIERDSERRYSTAEALAADLEAFLAGRDIAARRAGALERALRWARREPRQAALVGALLTTVFTAAVVGGLLLTSREEAAAGRAVQQRLELEDSLAKAYATMGQNKGSISEREFEQVLAADPTSAEAQLGRILARLRRDDKPGALVLLRDAPRTPAFDRLRALAEGRPTVDDDPAWLARATAIELFAASEALRLEGERRPISEQKTYWRLALERIDEAIARAPEARAVYHQMRALHASRLGDNDAARSASQALIALWPESAWSMYQAGSALVTIDPRRAIEVLGRAAELDPTHAATFQCIATAHNNLHELDAALAPLQRALALKPSDTYALNMLAVVESQRGCLDEARLAIERTLAVDPDFIQAWGNLVFIAPDPAETAFAAKHVIELDPGQHLYRAVFAEALLQLGRTREARDQFARLVAEQGSNAAYWLAYAAALDADGDPALALDVVAVTRALDPTTAGLDEFEQALRTKLAKPR